MGAVDFLNYIIIYKMMKRDARNSIRSLPLFKNINKNQLKEFYILYGNIFIEDDSAAS